MNWPDLAVSLDANHDAKIYPALDQLTEIGVVYSGLFGDFAVRATSIAKIECDDRPSAVRLWRNELKKRLWRKRLSSDRGKDCF